MEIMSHSMEHNGLSTFSRSSPSNYSSRNPTRNHLALDSMPRKSKLGYKSREQLFEPKDTYFGSKHNISALPSPDSTPILINIDSPPSESSLLSPPLEFDIPEIEALRISKRKDSNTSLPRLASPDFPEADPASPRSLPSLKTVMAYTRERTDVPQSKPEDIQPGRWLALHPDPLASHVPQVYRYMNTNPREWSALLNASNDAYRHLHHQQVQRASVSTVRNNLTTPSRPSRPRAQSNRTPRMSTLQHHEPRPATTPRRPRKRMISDETQTPPRKKKAPSSENKVKYDHWQQIAHFYAIVPQIPAYMQTRDYLRINRNEMFKGFSGGSGIPIPSRRLDRADANIHLLCEFEIELCEMLGSGWDTNKFLIHKLRLFHAKFNELKSNSGKAFNKTRAQQAGQCDVNSMSRFFEVYSFTGLLNDDFIRQSVSQKWNEEKAKITLEGVAGVKALEDPNKVQAMLNQIRTSDRVSEGQDSPFDSKDRPTPKSTAGSTTSPSVEAASSNVTPADLSNLKSTTSSPIFDSATDKTVSSSGNGSFNLGDPIYSNVEASSERPDLFRSV